MTLTVHEEAILPLQIRGHCQPSLATTFSTYSRRSLRLTTRKRTQHAHISLKCSSTNQPSCGTIKRVTAGCQKLKIGVADRREMLARIFTEDDD